MKDLYRLLGVMKSATDSEIKKAYRSKAKKAHPDAGGSEEKFSALKEAHDVLLDADRRAHYDKTGEVKPGQIDPGRGPLLAQIGAMLGQIVGQAAKEGTDIRYVDVVDLMVQMLRERMKAFHDSVAILQRRQSVLEKMAGRFSADEGGEDVLSLITAAAMSSVEQEIRMAEAAIGHTTEVLKLVKTQRYRQDLYRSTQGFTVLLKENQFFNTTTP